jgi:hypothetical protein
MSTVPTALAPDPRIETVETQLGEQRDVIQSLFEAFKLLTEENAKKDKRLDKLESDNSQLKQLISFHLVEGLENVRSRVEKMDKLDHLDKDVFGLKQAIEDIKFAMVPVNSSQTAVNGMSGLRSPSPQRATKGAPPPLPFMAEASTISATAPLIGAPALEKIQLSLETLLSGLDYVGRQRNSDVKSINASLEKLDSRIKQLATMAEGAGGLSLPLDRGPATNEVFMKEVRQIRDELIPELEHEWSDKWGSLEARIDQLVGEIRKSKEEVATMGERMIVRDSRMAQLNTMAESSKRLMDKTEQLSSQVHNKILKLESDVQIAFEEIKRVEESTNQIMVVESKLDLSKSECRANWERVIRTTKQDVDGLRMKIERLSIVKDEYDRLSTEMRSLHDLVITVSTKRGFDNDSRMAPISMDSAGSFPRFSASARPPVNELSASSPQLEHLPHSTSPSIDTSNSSLSLMDEGLAVANGIIARLSAFPSILVPTGGVETGSLRVDSSTNRILWRIENVASMIREPLRYPKILVSPEFTATPVSNGKEAETLVGRMKLFPSGSDQSRIDGNCSFYLRCLPGITVRYSVDIAGEVMDTFECSYEKQRDKGKHDFVKLNEYLQPDGAVIMGIEIKSVAAMQN